MDNILNKFILIIGMVALFLQNSTIEQAILPILILVAITWFLEFFNNDNVNIVTFVSYSIVCIFSPNLLMGMPLILYEVFFSKDKYICLLTIIPYVININMYSPTMSLLIIGLVIVSVTLKYKALKYERLHCDYIRKRDDLTELYMSLEEKVKELQNKQDLEVNNATLNERNRISREIHDNVGHLLTSAILQIGAVMVITKEEISKNLLDNIKTTLDQGMNSIRRSIHNLHDDSVDLYVELSKITNEFSFCKATLNYEFSSKPNMEIMYSIIAIVKESLSNVIKHSNATLVTISLHEHPRLYQVIILDNGTNKSVNIDRGMGLQSIEKRVVNMNGIVNFDDTKGFKIFISIMK